MGSDSVDFAVGNISYAAEGEGRCIEYCVKLGTSSSSPCPGPHQAKPSQANCPPSPFAFLTMPSLCSFG